MTLAIRPAGHADDFGPLADAPRDGSVVVLRFRDPADPSHLPADRVARFEQGLGKVAHWRMCDTHDVLLERNADGWAAASPDEATLAWAEDADASAVMAAASQSDLVHDRAKAGNKLPWQVALAAAGQARAGGRA